MEHRWKHVRRSRKARSYFGELATIKRKRRADDCVLGRDEEYALNSVNLEMEADIHAIGVRE